MVEEDKAFYFRNLDGESHRAVLTHVDNFELVGTAEFITEILSVVGKELMVSKVEEDKFRYTGLDVKSVPDGIEISMEDYSRSLKKITEVRKTNARSEPLAKLEMKLYQKMTGKIAWLANSTRPDLCFQALQI